MSRNIQNSSKRSQEDTLTDHIRLPDGRLVTLQEVKAQKKMEKTIKNYVAMLRRENLEVPEHLDLDTLLAFKRPKNIVFPTLEAIKKQKLKSDAEGTTEKSSGGKKRKASETVSKETTQSRNEKKVKQQRREKEATRKEEEDEEENKQTKRDPFAKAKKIADEKRNEKERAQREKEEKERKRKESEQERKKKKSQAFQKTKKGQPVLKNVIGSLLNKIEKQK